MEADARTGPEPLSREDQAILDLEGPTVVGHTCRVIRLDAPGVEPGPLAEVIGERVGKVPELCLRLSTGGGGPGWVPDEDFRLERHLSLWNEGDAISESDFPAATATLFAQHLDRSRPLWALDLVQLEDGGSVLVWRIHHALADGSTAMRLSRELLWDERAGAGRPATSAARHADHSRRRARLARLLEHEFSRTGDRSPFDGRIGTDREVAFATVPLVPLHNAAKSLAGATLNDAVLSVVGGAIRHWMEIDRLALPEEIRVKVPVSLHEADGDTGNRDSYFTVPLHLDQPDPVARLEQVKAATAERKSGHEADELDRLAGHADRLSPRLTRLLSRAESDPRRFALNVSNVRGPEGPVTVLGAAVVSYHSIAEIGLRHALRVSVVSCGGRLCFGFCADPGLVGDLEVMAGGIRPAAGRLIDAASGRPGAAGPEAV